MSLEVVKMLGFSLTLSSLLYLIVGLVLLIIVNAIVLREESVFLKVKDHSFLPAFDYSIILLAFLLIQQLLPTMILKYVWLAISLASLYYIMMKIYRISWKEALNLYGLWLVFWIILAFILSAAGGQRF